MDCLLLLCRTSMAADRSSSSVESEAMDVSSTSLSAAAETSASVSSTFAYSSKSFQNDEPLPSSSSDEINGVQDDIVQQSNLDLDALEEEGGQDEFTPTKVDAAADKPSAPLPPVPQVTGCRTQGQIAVTFSEGPSDATAKMVRQLNNADARANFFVNATWLYTQQYAMVLQNTYNAGHFIGMTYRVKNDDSSVLTDAEIREDILKNARTIESLIHVAPKYVRLHYTQPEDTRTENILKDLGFVLVGYNLDSQDYLHKPIQEVYKNAFDRYKETYDAKGSFISVQYDVPGTVHVSSVPRLVNTINDEGYTMVRLDGCLNDPKPYKKSAESKEYVSDKYSFNTTGYHQGQKPVPQSVIDASEQEDGVNNDKEQETHSGASASIATSIWCGLAAVLLGLAVKF